MSIPIYQESPVDVVVIGAGHAGCEAGLAAAKLGKSVVLFSISLESVADMPCNPNIGGTGKGHLVREIDALGGEMGLVIDETFIQSRMLNTAKGPAIHSLRVQADKRRYHEVMKRRLEAQEGLRITEAEVNQIDVENGVVKGVLTMAGAYYPTKSVIICTGTFLNGTILMGELSYASGPHGMKASTELSKSLEALNIPLRRFKTGTPARIHRRSVDFSKMTVQKGDEEVVPFSFLNQGEDLDVQQHDCYLTYTTEETARIIRENIHRSPMYAGEVHGVGPRYCPSVEDKIMRFPDREQHQVFLEPEGTGTQEMYVQGVSSTLPEQVQKELYRTIIGLENVEFMRPAYGIEYDCIDSTILDQTLQTMHVKGLYFAGQINGSSGYEEAAAQGLVAGINASRQIDGLSPFVLDRSEAYIGVLIDDLVTKGTDEPYRMMTSRCEYRLSLRQDNADLRLTPLGHKIGLASDLRLERMREKETHIEAERKRLESIVLGPKPEVNEVLESLGSAPLKTGVSLSDLIRRPELTYEAIRPLDPDRPELPKEARLEVETQIKYEGYIEKQAQQIAQYRKLENRKLDVPDYSVIRGLKTEAAQKLNRIQPTSVGQASRISGVSPADINVLLIYLETQRRLEKEEKVQQTDKKESSND